MTFELRSFGRLDGCEHYAYVCKSDSHKVFMTKEEAENRGIAHKWQDGYVWATILCDTVVVPGRFEVPRAGKRPKIVKYPKITLVCPECKRAELISLAQGEIIEHLRTRSHLMG